MGTGRERSREIEREGRRKRDEKRNDIGKTLVRLLYIKLALFSPLLSCSTSPPPTPQTQVTYQQGTGDINTTNGTVYEPTYFKS